MFTIASLLDTNSDDQVKSLWGMLDDKCSLRGIQLTPLPHISWQAGDSYQVDKMDRYLEDFSKHHEAFEIKTTGLGIFTGEKVILYLALAQSLKLLNLHNTLWKSLKPFGESKPHYEPKNWVPHITLANKDVTRDNISCAITELADKSLNYAITINSLAILYDNQDEIGIKSIYKLKG